MKTKMHVAFRVAQEQFVDRLKKLASIGNQLHPDFTFSLMQFQMQCCAGTLECSVDMLSGVVNHASIMKNLSGKKTKASYPSLHIWMFNPVSNAGVYVCEK